MVRTFEYLYCEVSNWILIVEEFGRTEFRTASLILFYFYVQNVYIYNMFIYSEIKIFVYRFIKFQSNLVEMFL